LNTLPKTARQLPQKLNLTNLQLKISSNNSLVNIKILALLFFPFLLFSQNKITLEVKDNNTNPIQRAIVIVSQDNKQINSGTTDASGTLNLLLPTGDFILTINKLGYETSITNIVVDKSETITVTLSDKINKLDDVVIKSRPKIMKIKTDTISYNLKAIVDGTEKKVEDIIKKLPGFDVDQAGKVSFKGKEIGNILIDGNEFFNNKHQLATQNIDADLIDGIDLLTNYSGFSGEYSGGSNGTALNLKTKEGYKNKWMGDIESKVGFNNSLLFHNNLFKFSSKGNIAVILDYNTVAKNPITIDDYIDMQNIGAIKSSESIFTNFEIPTFLNSNSYFTARKNSFVAANYTYLVNPKLKITASTILNNANNIQAQNKNQTNLNDANNSFSFSDYKDADYFLSNTNFKLEYKKSKKTFISYIMGLTPDSNKEKNDIQSLNTIHSRAANNNFNFAQQFQVLTSLGSKIKYTFSLVNKFSTIDKSLMLNSTSSFFDTEHAQLNQNIKQKNSSSAINNTFSVPSKKGTYTVKINLLHDKNIFDSQVDQLSTYTNNLELTTQKAEVIPSWKRQWNNKWNSTLAAKLTYNNVQLEPKRSSFYRLEPLLRIVYAISSYNILSFNYTTNHKLPIIDELQSNNTILDFQTIKGNSLINYNQISPSNEFSIEYQNINSRNQSVLFTTINYSTNAQIFTTNTNYEPSSITIQPILANRNNLINGLALYHLKFSKIPLSLKNTILYRYTSGDSQINALENTLKTKLLSTTTTLQSNFKKAIMQFDLGFNYKNSLFEQSINSFSNNTSIFELSFLLRGQVENKIKWDIGINRNYQNSSYTTNTINFLNTNLEYNLSKTVKIKCNGFNLLNLNTSKIIKTNLDTAFFTETTTQIMPGYLLLGLNYSY
jgi:hypothetical protein